MNGAKDKNVDARSFSFVLFGKCEKSGVLRDVFVGDLMMQKSARERRSAGGVSSK